jgi:hypothetical protein
MAEDFRISRGILQGNRNIQIDDSDIDQCIYDLDDKMRNISNDTFSFIERYNIHPIYESVIPIDPMMRVINEETYDQEEYSIQPIFHFSFYSIILYLYFWSETYHVSTKMCESKSGPNTRGEL